MTDSKKLGWVRLHRQIEENPLYFLEPFTKAQAWIDLFLNANHKDSFFSIRGNIIKLKRGQLGWSELTMSKRWSWSKNRTRRFLNWLETEQQIEQQKDRFITTIITILNYDKFQTDKNDTADDTAERQQKDSRRYIDKNDKNVKNDKETNTPAIAGGDIQKVFEIFYRINPGINYGNITTRKAADWLIGKFGLDKTLAMAEYAVKIQSEQYAPKVTTPYQLKEKLGDLKIYADRQKAQGGKIVAI